MGKVLVLSGYGLRLTVERGHLLMQDGIAERRRVRRLSRIDRQVRRIAIIGHAGTISLDAIRWLHDVKVPLVHLDTDGRVLALVAPDTPDHPVLRRAQAQAADSEVGLEIARQLLRQKLDGQERVLRSFVAGQLALPQMELGRRGLGRATDMVTLRLAEAHAAAAYWAAWARLPVRFRQSEADRVPRHWRTFGSRTSPLTGSPRQAGNPANAILNYLYAILEAEARLALLAVGCDPGIGIQHADQSSRDSFACDVMEAVRPLVDGLLLELLAVRCFRRGEFFETREGNCRLMPALAGELAETAPRWAEAVAPVAEGAAQVLFEHGQSAKRQRRWSGHRSHTRQAVRAPRLPTPLTEANRHAGRGTLHVEDRATGPSVEISTAVVQSSPTRHAPVSETPGIRSLTNLQDAEDSARRLLTAILAGLEPLTRTAFLRAVVPALRGVPAETIAAGVGLSVPYCAKIRAGRCVPRKNHWEAFRKVLVRELV